MSQDCPARREHLLGCIAGLTIFLLIAALLVALLMLIFWGWFPAPY